MGVSGFCRLLRYYPSGETFWGLYGPLRREERPQELQEAHLRIFSKRVSRRRMPKVAETAVPRQ